MFLITVIIVLIRTGLIIAYSCNVCDIGTILTNPKTRCTNHNKWIVTSRKVGWKRRYIPSLLLSSSSSSSSANTVGNNNHDKLLINGNVDSDNSFVDDTQLDVKDTVIAVLNEHKLRRISSSDKSISSSALEWEVYVDQSKSSLDRGGSATLDAFIALAPPSLVSINAAIFPTPIKNSKSTRGPAVRCIAINCHDNNQQKIQQQKLMTKTRVSGSTISIDVGNVDSVDKVHRILTKYMLIPNISLQACECLKWKYRGNGFLEGGKIDSAIDAYDKALATSVSNQEGIILLMRATAYLQRAASHRTELKTIVNELATMVPNTAVYQNTYQLAVDEPYLANGIFRRIVSDASVQEGHFRRIQYKHGLYQYALLQAAQDSLRATQLLDNYSNTWIRAGEILSELWKLQQSIQYYNKSIEIDPTLESSIRPIIERLHKRQDLLKDARAYGWSEDTLRLALDVAR